MTVPRPQAHSDPVLRPFLQSANDQTAQRHLQKLLDERALPTVDGVLRRKLSVARSAASRATQGQAEQDFDDLHGDVVAQVIRRLQEMREQPDLHSIADFDGYVAVTAYNAVHMHLRRCYPKRFSLENRLRYLLEHRQGLAVWQDERGVWVGGYAVWRTRMPAGESSRLQQILADPLAIEREMTLHDSALQKDPTWLIATIFDRVGEPIPLDDLVRICSDIWAVKDIKPEPPPAEDLPIKPGEAVDTVGQTIVDRVDLRRYWDAIRELAPKQRAALLLQARDPDGNSLIELLEMQGVASLREIAQAVDLPSEELAMIWNELPLEDARIAVRLGITTQYVALLRMNVRRRLADRFLG